MTGFFNRIFGKGAQPARREPDADDNRIAVALLAMLTKQFDLLGMELGTVPATGPYASPECRGALLGLCIGILQAERIEMTRDRCIDTFIAAFVLVYGDPAGRDLASQTVAQSAADDTSINRVSEFAIADAKGVYESGGVTSYTAFSLALHGMI